MAAAGGQTQSLHTNSFDEALALPTDFSAPSPQHADLPAAEGGPAARSIVGRLYYVERLPRPRPQGVGPHPGSEAMGAWLKLSRKPAQAPHRGSRAKTQARIDRRVQTSSASTNSASTSRKMCRAESRQRQGAPCSSTSSAAPWRTRRDRCRPALDAITKATESGAATCSNSVSPPRAQSNVGEITSP